MSLAYAIILAQIGVGWLFIRWLIASDRGPKEPRRMLFLAGVLGALAVPIGIFLETKFLPGNFTTEPTSFAAWQILLSTLLIGVIEEAAKSLPLALILYRKRYFEEITDGLIYFGISGMVFGIIEDIGYGITMGPGAGIAKIVFGPYSHAGLAIIIGVALARKKIQKRSWWLVAGGVLTAIVLHGVYDFGLFYGHTWTILLSLTITIFVNINILVALRRAQRTDRQLGLSATTNSLYCPYCGQPNPEHWLFCTRCGKKM